MIYSTPITRARTSFISRCVGAVLTVAVLAMPAHAQSLQTAAPNNGSGGVFMNLTAAGNALNITSFAAPFASAAGNAASVEVWTRAGTYAGFTASNAGWTLVETVAAVSAGTTTFAPITLTSALNIGAGQTLAVYLHGITAGGGLRYTGTAAIPPTTLWSNADLSLFSDVARTGAVPFAGTSFTPRVFSGIVNYTVVPAPGALALLAVAGLAGTRRRRQ